MFSPPYWSLRDYKVEGQIGLEKDFNQWLVKMWLVMDEIWRVLRKDGTVWVNLGDGYSSEGKVGGDFDKKPYGKNPLVQGRTRTDKIPAKCLLMLPERFALGCLERGWILRNKCIWQKPNPMPCSAKDRFTTTYEFLYFFVKSKKYWFDLDAVRRPHAESTHQRLSQDISKQYQFSKSKDYKDNLPMDGGGSRKEIPEILKQMKGNLNPAGANPGDVITTKIPEEQAESMGSPRARQWRTRKINPNHEYKTRDPERHENPAGANPGDFWSIPTQPSALPHYASYPEKLCETPLKAGCPRWICKQCGKARVRVTRQTKEFVSGSGKSGKVPKGKFEGSEQALSGDYDIRMGPQVTHHTIGWTFCSCLCPACGQADCKCGEKWRPGIVLDPFGGTGVTCKVAKRLGLNWIYIDIKPEYCKMAKKEIKKVTYQENMFT